MVSSETPAVRVVAPVAQEPAQRLRRAVTREPAGEDEDRMPVPAWRRLQDGEGGEQRRELEPGTGLEGEQSSRRPGKRHCVRHTSSLHRGKRQSQDEGAIAAASFFTLTARIAAPYLRADTRGMDPYTGPAPRSHRVPCNRRKTMAHRLCAALVAALGLFACALPASASQHLMKVVEVFPGTVAQPNAQYIVLQMYSSNQQFVAGFTLGIFDANDALVTSFTFPGNVPNGLDQAKILLATPEAETLFGVTADLAITPSLPLAGGAVCFGASPTFGFDCLSWGSFVDGVGGASGAGTPYCAVSGLTQGQALVCDLLAQGNADLNSNDCTDSRADHDCGDAEPLANPVGSTPGFLAASPACSVCGNNATEACEECDGTDDGACPGDCQVDCTCFSEFALLGKLMLVKDPQPGVDATRRKIVLKVKESASPHPITGNPITGGATLEVVLSGTTPSSQTFTLPPGAAFWSALGTVGFKYKDTGLVNGPIKLLIVKKTTSGNFILSALGKGSGSGPLNLVPPNTGTEARVRFIPGDGDGYCAAFGGVAGGTLDPNTNKVFKAKNPTAEGPCPPSPSGAFVDLASLF